MYIGKTPTVGNFQVCDAISVVNGQAAYTLQVGGVNVAPESANHMLVSLNGILQKPGSSFTISGSTMTFASNLATGDVIDFVQILGNVLDIGQPSDDTVTAAKINNDVISGQTALTSAPDSTDELLISDAGTIKRIDVSLVGGKNTPTFRAKVTADTDITNNTLVKVTFPSEDYDTASAYDTSTGKFTVPSGQGGKYFIYSQLFLNSGADSQLIQSRVILYKNGSLLRSTENEYAANNLRRVSLTLTTVEELSASDYLEIYTVAQDSSGTPNLYNTTGNPNFFGAFKIIE
jgi:hypothetical protein